MTHEKRQQRRERQRQNNEAPMRKEAMKVNAKRSREVQKATLNQESIAMENPMYIPEVHGNMPSTSDWGISESNARQTYTPPADEDMEEDECGDILPGHMAHRQSVPSGQRHALLNHRNRLFERCISGKMRVANDENECMDKEHKDDHTPLPQSAETKNGKKNEALLTGFIHLIPHYFHLNHVHYLIYRKIGPSIPPASTTSVQQVLDGTGNIQLF
jgi:hypothetical protein